MVNKVYVHVNNTLSELDIMIRSIKYNRNYNTSGFHGGIFLKCLNVPLAGQYNTLLGNNHREVPKSVVHVRQVQIQSVR